MGINDFNVAEIAATVKETRNILGVRKDALSTLERTANIPHAENREGYTSEELKRLFEALKKILK